MPTTDLNDLLETVELVRAELHPDLDPTFVEAVICAEEQNQEDDHEALKAIQHALGIALAKAGPS